MMNNTGSGQRWVCSKRLGQLLLVGGMSATVWAQAAPMLQATVLQSHANSIQQVPLSLAQMAALQQSPQRMVVLDAEQQVMPSRVASTQQRNQAVSTPLQLFEWPSSTDDAHWQQVEQLKLQLKQGAAETTVWLPMPSSKPSTQQADNKIAARTWLLHMPTLGELSRDAAVSQVQLHLSWQAQALSSAVRVEGSQNLSDWQVVGRGHILETHNHRQQLKQQHIDVQRPYRFWRVQFDQPIALQQAALVYQQKQATAWRTEQAEWTYDPSSKPATWRLDAPYPLQLTRLSVDVPKQQLWALTLAAQRLGQNRWQTLHQGSVFNVQQNAIHYQKNHIDLAPSSIAQQWRLTIQGANPTHLTTTLAAPQRYVVFLAQGQAPYRVQVGAGVPINTAQLPVQLVATHQAVMGKVSVVAEARPTRQYILWAGLIGLVLLLALAAWRLLRNMSDAPQH